MAVVADFQQRLDTPEPGGVEADDRDGSERAVDDSGAESGDSEWPPANS
jgi:hypothetical protein